MKVMENRLMKTLYDRGWTQVLLREQTGSTNRDLLELARQGAPHKTVLLARHQTAGVGRRGRSFFSPAGTGLYGSVLLRDPAADAGRITLTAAVAVALAVEEELGIALSVKWVNDLYWQGKKVCGILAQGVMDQEGLCYCVLGIGLNVFAPQGGFGELSPIAGALLDRAPDDDLLGRLTAGILTRFFDLYQQDFATVLALYRARCFLTGKTVTVVQGENRLTGVVDGVDHRGALVVRINGTPRAFLSGEVQLEDYR